MMNPTPRTSLTREWSRRLNGTAALNEREVAIAPPQVSKVPARARLVALNTERQQGRFQVQARLEHRGAGLEATTQTRTGRYNEHHAVAGTVLDAVNPALDFQTELRSVAIVSLGAERVAIVTVNVSSDVLEGSAIVKTDDHDAIARATLRAVNRKGFGS